MRTIEVSDEVYERLERRAVHIGTTVSAVVSDLASDGQDDFFTPELIAELERTDREMDEEGGSLTLEEAWASLEAHKAARKADRTR